MKSQIEIIAKFLIESVRDIVELKEKEIKYESFKLIFSRNTYSFIFLCSLHHLDMPWQINFLIKKGEIKIEELPEMLLNEKDYKKVNNYDITPIFLSSINANTKLLTERIRLDLIASTSN